MTLPPAFVKEVKESVDSLHQLLHRYIVVRDFSNALDVAENILYFDPQDSSALSFIDFAQEHIGGQGSHTLRLSERPHSTPLRGTSSGTGLTSPTSRPGVSSAGSARTPGRPSRLTPLQPVVKKVERGDNRPKPAIKAEAAAASHIARTRQHATGTASAQPTRTAGAVIEGGGDDDSDDAGPDLSDSDPSESDHSDDSDLGANGVPRGGIDSAIASLLADAPADGPIDPSAVAVFPLPPTDERDVASSTVASINRRMDIFDQLTRSGAIPSIPRSFFVRGAVGAPDGGAAAGTGDSAAARGGDGGQDSTTQAVPAASMRGVGPARGNIHHGAAHAPTSSSSSYDPLLGYISAPVATAGALALTDAGEGCEGGTSHDAPRTSTIEPGGRIRFGRR